MAYFCPQIWRLFFALIVKMKGSDPYRCQAGMVLAKLNTVVGYGLVAGCSAAKWATCAGHGNLLVKYSLSLID